MQLVIGQEDADSAVRLYETRMQSELSLLGPGPTDAQITDLDSRIRQRRSQPTNRHKNALHQRYYWARIFQAVPSKNTTTTQCSDHSCSTAQRKAEAGSKSKFKSINQSTNQSINQSTNQSINQYVNQSSRSINQSTYHSLNQSINQSINQWTNQSIKWSINQSTNQWVTQSIDSINRSVEDVIAWRRNNIWIFLVKEYNRWLETQLPKKERQEDATDDYDGIWRFLLKFTAVKALIGLTITLVSLYLIYSLLICFCRTRIHVQSPAP